MTVPVVGAPIGIRGYRILLDSPAARPGLQFDDYAEAIGDIILHSDPQFAIGIFGNWGSGKTTLMHAIERVVAPVAPDLGDPLSQRRDDVVSVWFNAWRYEREEHLIVPMLDTLREALAQWAAARNRDASSRSAARHAAASIGKAARALAAGLTLKAGVFDADVSFDPKRVMDALHDDAGADNPRSFYHASFREMEGAIDRFAIGERRIVIFVDDLDRCLPNSALEVLESMKLFFDLKGFIFVVGLDQKVVERAVELKYEVIGARTSGGSDAASSEKPAPSTGNGRSGADSVGKPTAKALGSQRGSISGTDYIKKIFQVSLSLPPVNREDLADFFRTVVETSDLPADQTFELLNVVWPHLDETTGSDAGSVNPREIKRFINGFTIQMKMLNAKLKRSPNPDVVLAIQNMAFRSEWESLYGLLTADPTQFVEEIGDALARGANDAFLGSEPLPTPFLAYMAGRANPLLREPSLEVYVSSAESTVSTDSTIAEARRAVRQMLGTLRRLGADRQTTEKDALSQLVAALSGLRDRLQKGMADSYFAVSAARLASAALDVVQRTSGTPDVPQTPPAWIADVRPLLEELDANLREVRRERAIGATSAA